jgi:bifunctional pyridoxal-dependent enzyme with beta-cystathionase and maltose regulon repressor activities
VSQLLCVCLSVRVCVSCVHVYGQSVLASKGHCSVVYMTLWQGETDQDSTIWRSSFHYDNRLLNCDFCHLDHEIYSRNMFCTLCSPPPPPEVLNEEQNVTCFSSLGGTLFMSPDS